jgi:signal transduction histidine kinase/ligand-binding sensor domain-containing protein/DNA-binding response OmpR family regulator
MLFNNRFKSVWRTGESFCIILLTVFIQLTGNIKLCGQENRYVFSHLNVNNGLSQNQINSIYRDTKGFVWFGTNAGLNRFDGSSIEIFKSEKSLPGSLGSDIINAITEDKLGNLWIGTGNGISILNGQTYRFSELDYNNTAGPACGDIRFINTLAKDQDGNIWIGTNNGVFRHSIVNGTTERIFIDEANCTSLVNSINSIVQDHNGKMWFGSKNGFIIKYDLQDRTSKKFKIPDLPVNLTDCVTRLFVDSDNDLWVGNLMGLYLFDTNLNTWKKDLKSVVEEPERLKRIGAVSQNVDGAIWVAADGGGAFIISKNPWKSINIKHQPFDDQKLKSDGLSFVLCDNDGIVWIGTTKKGVNYYKKNINKFRIYRNIPTDVNTLSNNDVNALAEDQNGNIWIGTDGGGLNFLDRKSHKITRIIRNGQSVNSLSSNIIVSLYQDHDQKLWIGTYFGGLNKYDPVTGRFTVYKNQPKDDTSISDDRIYGICEDSNYNIWSGTLGSGVNILNPITGKFRNFSTKNSALCFDMITSVYPDKNNIMWIGTEYGLSAYDPKNGTFKTYQYKENNNSSISDNNVQNFLEDSRGFFWICTKNGLNLLDRKSGSFRHFNVSDGLASASLHGIVEDKNGNLWISSNSGISRMELKNVGNENHFDFSFRNYDLTDGLQGKEFNRSSALCTSDGEIFFGGPDGLNAFYPDEIKNDTSVAKMIFRDFRIFNKSIQSGQNYNDRILLKKPIFNTDKIELKYRENSFTIEFAAINFFFPDKNSYTFKLDGFDKNWILTSGKNNSATYTNLNNGTYIFRVRELNENSGGREISMTIVVLPPFWKSWIAYLVYAILILMIFLLLRYLILTRERSNARIEQERIEAQHIHEIDTLKIKFFTNISHEFRTPLTLILGPLEKLQMNIKDSQEGKYLKLIEQNSRRLLRMVNQLLDFRKMEVQGFEYNHFYGDIIGFLREVVNSFNYLSEQKNIKLVFTTQPKELNTSFDRDKLEKMIFNLLSNAFKFTPGNGQVSVNIYVDSKVKDQSSTVNENFLLIEIADTGIGIPEDKLDKIFTRFFQVDNSGQVEKGTGIGLSLVAEFVKLHSGEISVRSEIGKGSCFTVKLPVSNSWELAESADKPIDEVLNISTVIPNNEQKIVVQGRPVLLIAEDNDDLRFYLKDNLLQQFEVLEASDGDTALIMIQKNVPDLIISDIMMPGIDGVELCKRVKSDRTICHIPFILLTAKSSEQQMLQGFEMGADDYITKPFNFQILEAKINNILSLRNSMRQLFKNKLQIEPRDITVTSLDEQFMQKVLDLAEKHIASTEYTVEMMSHDLGMSRTLLYKKILALTGKPPLEFLRSFRLKRAAMLLDRSQMNVSEIAFQVGFNDPKYFSRHFKAEFGVIPSKYVKNS